MIIYDEIQNPFISSIYLLFYIRGNRFTSQNTQKKNSFLAVTANYVDERLGVAGVLKEFGRKIFPDHWSFMLGEVALYSFLVLLLSGTFLTFFFQPSMTEVVYDDVS